MHFSAAFLTTFGEIVYVIKVVRAPLIVASLIAGVALLVPDQTREVYRILAQPWRAYGYVQLCFAVVAVVFATFVPLIVARHLTFRHAQSVLQERSLAGGLSRWLPRMCGALIPLGLAFGLLIASSEMAFELPKPVIDASPSLAQLRADALGVASSLKWSSALCILLALVALLDGASSRIRGNVCGAPTSLFGKSFNFILLAFVVLASIVVSLAPVAIGQVMGSLAILLVFVTTLVLTLGSLTSYFDTYRVPVISCFFLLGVVFSALGWNDNHAVRLEKRDAMGLPSAREALNAWLQPGATKIIMATSRIPCFSSLPPAEECTRLIMPPPS